MDLTLSLDAREVLFHLNYMGYRNVSKEQLKSFMIDLKKLIKYETQPQKLTTEVNFQAGTSQAVNIRRLFETQTETSKNKQREKHCCSENPKNKDHICRPKLKHQIKTLHETESKISKKCNPKSQLTVIDEHNKENLHDNNNPAKDQQNNRLTSEKEPVKSKMWIRPKSAQSARQVSMKKRNDPVALYQEYQKDWEKFRSNICESSRSELRWTIREKLLANH